MGWSRGDLIGEDVAATTWAPPHQTFTLIKLKNEALPSTGPDPPLLRGPNATNLIS
jgi:hypothetical protein